jgi:hypothetical protein
VEAGSCARNAFATIGRTAPCNDDCWRARKLILHSGHQVRFNWNLTEKEPRVGNFFGREFRVEKTVTETYCRPRHFSPLAPNFLILA